jgi:ketosteroid isomerase-like protein
VNTNKNKEAIRRVLTAYSEGDFAPLRALLDPGIVYQSHSPKGIFRFGGRHEGMADAVVALSALASDYTVHHIQLREMVGEGDVVWVTMDMDYTERRTGVRLVIPVAARWEFRDGRIVSIGEFWDTVDVALKHGLVKANASRQ